MSAMLQPSNQTHLSTEIIWSNGGGSFRRLVWKELSELAGLFGAFALGLLVAALWARWELVHRREMYSLPILLLQSVGFVFPVIVGARAFAREIENGTWELLRSAGASAWNVWFSKLLVALLSSLGISVLRGTAISLSHSYGVSTYLFSLFDSLVGWSAFLCVLVLTVSMQCSLWLRRAWLAMVVSAGFVAPLVYMSYYPRTGWRQRYLPGLPDSDAFGFFWLSALVATFIVLLWTTQLWQLRRELFDHSAIHDSQRWQKVFGRVIWKELLSVRDFWLAVIGILIVLDGCAFWGLRDPMTRDRVIVALGVMMPLLHSLGCGAITFSLEREDGTQDWLRRISAPASAVFAAKLLVSQASIVSLTSLVLMGTQAVVAPDNRLTNDGCAAILLTATLNGVVSLGTSMLTWRVLPAVFLAFVGIVAIDYPLLVIGFGAYHKGQPFFGFPLAILPWWLLVGTVLLATEWPLADRWLNERRWWPRRWRPERSPGTQPRGPEFWFDWSSSPEKRIFGRLMWREWMEAKGWLWVLPIAFVPSLNFDMMDYVQRTARNTGVWLTKILLIPACTLLVFGLCVLPALLGVWAFHHDQRQGLFRFLADRGGSPQRIWWSKQAVWLTLVLVLAGLAGAITELQSSDWQRRGLAPGELTGFALVFALQSYAAGQAMSQWNRSALISMFLAGVLSLLLWGWTVLLSSVVRAPWPYQLGAAAILFSASWRSSRDWLEERWSWLAWLRIVLNTALPFAVLVLLLELQGYRVWDVLRNFG